MCAYVYVCVVREIRSRDSCDFALDHPGLKDGQTAAIQFWAYTQADTTKYTQKPKYSNINSVDKLCFLNPHIISHPWSSGNLICVDDYPVILDVVSFSTTYLITKMI